MVKFKRLSPEERKKQICAAAKKIFLKKGFNQTTMEDIINASGMSTGGVYNYYKNKSDIMYDLMIEGSYHRFNLVDDYINSHKDMDPEELFIEISFDKLFDYNEFKSLYAMILQESSKDEKLKELYDQINEKGKDLAYEFFEKLGIKISPVLFTEAFTSFYNSLLLGIELLDNRDVFIENKDLFKCMIKTFINYTKGEDDGK